MDMYRIRVQLGEYLETGAISEELSAFLDSILEFKAGHSLEEIQAEYQERIYGAMADYLQSDRPITAFRNLFHRLINDAFLYAFVAGWVDAGAEELTDEARAWLNDRISRELAFCDTLFIQLKTLRNNTELTMEEKLDAAQARASGYAGSLVGVYAMGKMMGKPNRVGIWKYGDTSKHCSTCGMLHNKRHTLAWFIQHGYIPQEHGSSTLACKGFHCLCKIIDPKTGEQLIP